MSYTEEQLWKLLDQAYHMPYGPGQIALVEQVIGHADAQHLTPLAFAARMQATSSYVYGGEPVRSFATFAWCLAEFDRNPQAYQRDYRILLWHFKYMIGSLTRFPEIPLERTYGVLDDMERRWRETGHSMHAVYACRHRVAAHIGDVDTAESYYVQWCAAPRDDLSDCVGCDPSQKAAWLSRRKRYEEAVALGEPVLSGRLTCSEQPQDMLVTLMLPYLRTGRLDQARDAHRRAYRLHRPHLADLGSIADHIEFCARTGNEARAVEIVERHLGWLDRAPSPWTAMLFAAASSLALRRAQERHGDELTLHRPAHGDREAARVTATELATELDARATELAASFDRRNGTARVGTMVRETLAGEPWIEYLALSPTAAPVRRTGADRSTVEDLFAKTPPAAPPPPQPAPFVVPETAGPDELLDLIEEYYRNDQDARADEAMAAFDTRYGDRALTTHQRARLADARATQLADRQRFDDAATTWREAAQDYAAAGEAEGEHRALARSAAALCWQGGHEDGLAALGEATEWLLAHGSATRRVSDATRLAIVLHNRRQPEAALAILDRVSGDLENSPLRDRARHAVVRLSTLAQLQAGEEILRTGPAAIELAEAAGTDDDRARAHSTLAAALQHAGRIAEAADQLGAAVALVDDEQVRVGMRRARADLLARTERAAEAVDELVEYVAEATARGQADEAAAARHSLAIAYLNTGRPLDAAEVAEEELAYRLRADTTTADERLDARNLLTTIYQRLGQPVEAVEQLDAMAEELARDGERAAVGQLAQRSGEILSEANRDEAAAARFLVAAEVCVEIDQPLPELYNRRRHAISLRWAGRIDEAVTALAAADAVVPRVPADEESARWELTRLEFDAARILWAAGRLPEAAQRAGQAGEASLRLDSPGSAAESRLMQAQILLEAGQPAQAEAAVQQGLAVLPDGADREPYDQVLEAARQASSEDQ